MQAFGAKHSGEVGFKLKFVRSGSLALSLTNSSENSENLGFRLDFKNSIMLFKQFSSDFSPRFGIPAQGYSVG